MADELKDLKDGLKTRLETISGLRVYDQPPSSPNEFPCAVIVTGDVDYQLAFAGNTFGVELLVHILLAQAAQPLKAWEDLDNYLNPVGTKSIRATVEGDQTLGGAADWAKVVSAAPPQFRGGADWWGGTYHHAIFTVECVKTVA